MKILLLALTVMAVSSCAYQEYYFVRNHEQETVTVTYKYDNTYEDGEEKEPNGNPMDDVWIMDGVMTKKQMKKWTYKSSGRSVPAQKVSDLVYQFELPADKTAYVPGAYLYDPVEYFVVNQNDTLSTSYYPTVLLDNKEYDTVVEPSAMLPMFFVATPFTVVNIDFELIKATKEVEIED